jgi:hypothetical protein
MCVSYQDLTHLSWYALPFIKVKKGFQWALIKLDFT